MNETLLFTLIFGVAYPLVTLAVWSVGAFGIAANTPEIQASAAERAEAEWGRPYGTGTYVAQYQRSYFRSQLAGLASLTLIAGVLWPAAIPVYLSWKKGTFVAAALAKRDALANGSSS